MQLQWVGANGNSWDTVTDWDFYGGGAAGFIPDGSDIVILIAGYGPLITGDGTANAIDADAPYTLSGAITLVASGGFAPQFTIIDTTVTITGSVNDAPSGSGGSVSVLGSGQLVLSGASDQAEALVTSTVGVLSGAGNTPSDVTVSLGTWNVVQNSGDSGSGDLDVGAGGAGILDVGYLGTVTANTLEVGTEAQAGISSVLSVGPSGTLSVAGALTIGGTGFGTLIDDGTLSAGSVTFAVNSAGVVKGVNYTDSLTVDAGALLDGAAGFYGLGSTPDADTPVFNPLTTIVDDGTIEGAVSIIPMTLDGPVIGSGTLLIDPGGGIDVAAAVAPTIAVRFAPGVGAINVAVDGAAGGVLYLEAPDGSSDLAGFTATIYGFGPGDAIDIDPSLGVTSATLAPGNILLLENSSDVPVGTLQLDPNASYANESFLVEPAQYGNGLLGAFASLGLTEIVVVPDAPSPTMLAAPVLTLPGPVRAAAGTATVLPPISVLDVAGYNDSETFTVTLTATSGTFTGLVNLQAVESSLFGESPAAFLTPASDFSDTFGSDTFSLAGIGTDTLTLTSSDLTLIDMQLALIQYDAAATAGSDTIGVSVTASGTGADQTASGSIAVTIGASGTAFAWTGASDNSFDTPGNWSGSVAGPPVAGDTVTFGADEAGAPSYAVTGDGTGGQTIVTANVLFQGEISTGGGPADAPALIADGGGIAGFAGIAVIEGDAAAGYAGTSGTIDFYGIVQGIKGNLIDGDGGAGDVQIDGAVEVGGNVSVGLTSDASMELGAGGLGFGLGEVAATDFDIGVGAGVSGTVTVSGADITASGALTVGDAGDGTLIVTRSGNFPGDVQAQSVVIGAQAGSSGTVTLMDPSTTTGTDANTTLSVLSDTLTVGEAGSGTLSLLGTATLLIGASLGYASGSPNAELDIAALPGSTGLVTGNVFVPNVAIGGTSAASGGQGTLVGTLTANQTTVWGDGLLQGSIYSTQTTDDGAIELQGGTASTNGVYGGELLIASGGSLQGPGSVTNFDTVENDGTIAAMAGTLTIYPAVSGTGTLLVGTGGTLALPLGFSGTQTIDFADAATFSTDAIPAPSSGPATLVNGFAAGDQIVLSYSVPYQTLLLDPNTLSYTQDSGDPYATLDIYDDYGDLEDAIAFSGLPAASTRFELTPDTETDTAALTIACFAQGTRIATGSGEVAVENLRVGDRVLTAGGLFRPITWIGRRRVDPARHPKPGCVLPVCVRRDAFGARRPHRDLFLSPDHAVFVEDVLIPVQYLVNHETVRQPPACGPLTYFHIELDRHDVLFAEGLAVESYLETGNRAAFEHGGPALVLHPDFRNLVWEALGYAPLVVTGPELEAARRLLAGEAALRPATPVAA
jgi:T5SS/PEP-CTERM-associated repeat protein